MEDPKDTGINRADILSRLHVAGELLPIDKETGKIIYEKLSKRQKEELTYLTLNLAGFLREVVSKNSFMIDVTARMNEIISLLPSIMPIDELRDTLNAITKDLLPIQELTDELNELQPFLETELKKDEYNGLTIDDIENNYTPAELYAQRHDPDSLIYKAFEAARARREIVVRQQQGRDERKTAQQKALEQNAVMALRNGQYYIFSDRELWNAFSPGRICKIGTLSRDYIDKQTGLVQKTRFGAGEIEILSPMDISQKALTLLSTILANTVNNIREEPIKNLEVRFYVKGVLDALSDDARTLYDGQITLDRKTAGAVYLEKLFEPLLGYIGTTPNGSRYSVFNYIGYDLESDTMTVQSPYLYQLWKTTQTDYFTHAYNKKRALDDNKRPQKADLAPIKVNALFKGKAVLCDDITLEIATYITNVLLTAGNKGAAKKTKITYKTIIKNCPRLKLKLEEIENGSGSKNPTARYNDQLKKIARAFDLIYDPNQCDALKYYEFIDIQPGKITKGGKFKFTAPTKSKINEHLIIEWRKKTDDDPT